jgi:hypothetical protein
MFAATTMMSTVEREVVLSPGVVPTAPGVRTPPSQERGWSARTFLGGTVGVLAARSLYLLRFGWDFGWMNCSYLERARAIALGRNQTVEEEPLAYFALLAARRLGLGLSARAANEAVYLVAHLLLGLGVLGLARFIWPAASARRRLAVAVTMALVPLAACEPGRNNLGVSLGAGLAAAALAMAALASTAECRHAASAIALAFAALLAALAAGARYEAFLTCLGGAGVLALLGSRMPGLVAHRRAALVLAVGAAAGLAVAVDLRLAFAGGKVGSDSTYGFYTFYDGLPLPMFPHLLATEHARYQASLRFFGGYDENGGSVLRALLHHPGFAVLRVLTKPVDQFLILLWLNGLTPVGVALAVAGGRGIARRPAPEWQRGWILAAHLLPLGMLFIPQRNPAYYMSVVAPLVLAVARGADRVGGRLSPRPARLLAAATVVAGVVLVAVAGKLEVTNSRALNQAAVYLEARCQTGCLTNALPQALGDQAWVVTDAGAPFPPRQQRREQAILGDFNERRAEQFNYCARVRRARAAGFTGPVLFVDARIHTFTAFDPDFDPEVRFQGTVERADLVEERRFSVGPDTVIVYQLPPDRACRPAAGATQ